MIFPHVVKKLSNSLKGRNVWNKGVKNCYNEEQRKRLSESHKGKRHESLLKPIKQLDLNGNLIRIWKCRVDASRELGIQASNIWKCLNGQRNKSGGFKWEYV